jgi:hypothetical protein
MEDLRRCVICQRMRACKYSVDGGQYRHKRLCISCAAAIASSDVLTLLEWDAGQSEWVSFGVGDGRRE